MNNGQVSIGDDTPTGEPENGPRGPYITDKDDGTPKPKQRTNKEIEGDDTTDERPLPTRTETEITRQSELGSDR